MAGTLCPLPGTTELGEDGNVFDGDAVDTKRELYGIFVCLFVFYKSIITLEEMTNPAKLHIQMN